MEAEKGRPSKKTKRVDPDSDLYFVGSPIPVAEAKKKWPLRYPSKVKKGASLTESGSSDEEKMLEARCHYEEAVVDGVRFKLGDNAYVKAEDEHPDYIARIIELFETIDKEPCFRAQWFYRAEDTVIKTHSNLVDKRRVFLSEVQDDNPLDSIVSKVEIAQMDLNAKEKTIPPCDLYYDMKYTLPYLTFSTLDTENPPSLAATSSSSGSCAINETGSDTCEILKDRKSNKSDLLLLDLYSGCGAMSTGLCFGANLAGVKLVTKWAVDINSHACESLKLNHPNTEVRNEAAEDFLSLLKEWEKLCKQFILDGIKLEADADSKSEESDDADDVDDDSGSEVPSGEFEVGQLLAICFGDPNGLKQAGLYFKVRWKGYDDPSEDTWEPLEGLSDCQDKLKDFVTRGYNSKMLPLPGLVDILCGGPPCQGVSGFNRFRNLEAPLDDTKNRQLVVYMDIIQYLRPKYVLMENVVDILKFAGGFLGRYAVGRLVSMDYQARLGMLAAGCYGVPQFRMRVFLWGALPSEKLPQYPLPTHDVLSKGVIPTEFEEIYVQHDKRQPYKLEKAIDLDASISDLPPATNEEIHDEREYGTVARTDFQKYIRLKKSDLINYTATGNDPSVPMLYDHQPLKLNDDDYERVCRIPMKKGANFRDLPGVVVSADNKVEWDKSIKRVLVKSGKPLVPDYAMSFVKGRSSKPFGRLWWDEIINTVVTRAEPHNQAVLHPAQDRVLTIRENARIQGFPDSYKLMGPIKERYMQVGNAVAVPVALSLGYTFGLAYQKLSDDKPITTLPFLFPKCLAISPEVVGETV